MDMLVILVVLLLFAALAWVAGADSREPWNSQEWERRQHWQGFGGDGQYNS